MNPQQPPQQPNQPQQPVAYDAEGRPLYAAPPTPPTPTQPVAPQVVHLSRAVTPVEPEISPEIKAKHEESKQLFPQLNLSGAEYVISAVRRHPIGLAFPVGLTIFLIALMASFMINYPLMVTSLGWIDAPPQESFALIGGLFILLFLLAGYIAVWIYTNNKFFLTNESVIQEIQTSLFSRHEQTVSLANIEDASFVQKGILQNLLNYGSIRLSTEGDETTYRFHYVANPKRQIAILNDAVEAFKNGRPIDFDER
jgi:uncharacterized membrane protein YdbT with pleckstrin-like domain